MKSEGELLNDYTDGRWVAMTMGQFLQILVDSGHDPAIVFRVDEDWRVDDKSFGRKMTVYSLPNGAVKQFLKELHFPEHKEGQVIHKLLFQLIQAGLVE